MDTVQATVVTPVNVTPVGAQMNAEEDLRKTMQDTAQAVEEALNDFSDEVPTDDETTKAKGFLKQFTDYIKGDTFKRDINDTAKKYGVPPKKLAQNFFEKALGTIGDVLGIAINTVGNAGHTLIDILATVAHGAVNLIVNVANALARIVTLNKTCVA